MGRPRNPEFEKHCNGCPHVASCARSRTIRSKCYQRWYNRTCRDKEAERLRQAELTQNRPADRMLYAVRQRAKKEGLEFDLDKDWIEKRINHGVCEETGIPFKRLEYKRNGQGRRGPWAPSIDRIDNAKGYTKSNCRVVVWMLNLMKSNWGDSDVQTLGLALAAKKLHKPLKQSNSNFRHYIEGVFETVTGHKDI